MCLIHLLKPITNSVRDCMGALMCVCLHVFMYECVHIIVIIIDDAQTETEMQYLEKALAIYIKLLGETSQEVADVLKSAAAAHHKLGM